LPLDPISFLALTGYFNYVKNQALENGEVAKNTGVVIIS
jgi:hypothetical protein